MATWTDYVAAQGGSGEDAYFDPNAGSAAAQQGGSWSGDNLPVAIGRINSQGYNGTLFRGADGYYFNGKKLGIDDATAQAWVGGKAEADKQERESTNFGDTLDKFGEIAVPLFLSTVAGGIAGFGPLAGAGSVGAGAAGAAGGIGDLGAWEAGMSGGAGGASGGAASLAGTPYAGMGGVGSLTSGVIPAVDAPIPTAVGGSVAEAGAGLVDPGLAMELSPGVTQAVTGVGSDTLAGAGLGSLAGSGVTDEMLLTGQAGLGDLGVGTGVEAGWSGAAGAGAAGAGAGFLDTLSSGIDSLSGSALGKFITKHPYVSGMLGSAALGLAGTLAGRNQEDLLRQRQEQADAALQAKLAAIPAMPQTQRPMDAQTMYDRYSRRFAPKPYAGGGIVALAGGGLSPLPGVGEEIAHRRSATEFIRNTYPDIATARRDLRNPDSPLHALGIRGPSDPLLIAAFSEGGREVSGPGTGTSDSIPALIDNQQPAALSAGEFVIPSHVVSALGDGSTKAGSDKLHALVERVTRKAGTGKASQVMRG